MFQFTNKGRFKEYSVVLFNTLIIQSLHIYYLGYFLIFDTDT